MIDQNAAAKRAEALLALPLDVGQQRFGTTDEAPPPGTGPILVVKDTGEARYLGLSPSSTSWNEPRRIRAEASE
jgi:hypothetical protein